MLVPFFGAKHLASSLTAKHVEAFRQERGQARAVATVNVDHNILKHMLKQAMKRDLHHTQCCFISGRPEDPRMPETESWNRGNGIRLYGSCGRPGSSPFS